MPFLLNRRWIGMMSIALAATACGKTDDTPAAPSTPPEYTALYDTLPAATPNKLRGVWTYDQSNPAGPAQLRFRFSDDSLLIGIRCTYNTPGYAPVITGETQTATITGIDDAAGTFTFPTDFNFTARPDVRVCEGQFSTASYTFKIQDNVLTLTTATTRGTLVLNKVGD